MKLRTTILGSALAATMVLTAGAASATTIIGSVAGGPFSDLNTLGTIDSLQLNSKNIYDFVFQMVAPIAGTTTVQIEAEAHTMGGTPLDTQFQIYEGAPSKTNSTAGTLIGTSMKGLSSALTESLGVGSYYVQILPSEILTNNEVAAGSLATTAVPEPATWAVMFLGFGAIGASMRNARRRQAAVAA